MRDIRSIASIFFAVAAGTAPAAAADVQSRLQENWRAEIAVKPVPVEGCFKAAYPSLTWRQVTCTKAPPRPFIPRTASLATDTVGDGNDYSAVAHGTITTATGSFPTVTGLTSENDGGANVYSIQLNSNFFKGAACNGATDPANCLSWEQFVYSSSSQASFIQYWLINYGDTCPTTPYNDWNSFDGDCYRNSNAVAVPQEPASSLSTIKLQGTVTSASDAFITFVGTTAYRTGGNDNVVFLASGWGASEFNIVGDGGGSKAVFNKGTSITVHVGQKDGTTTAPTCAGDAGTTGETNNLKLGKCTAKAGATPSISFKEKL